MKTNVSMRPLIRPIRLALIAGAATMLVGAALELPAAAAATPYVTSTTISSSVKAPVTGQPVTFTATVRPPKKSEPAPDGTVVFTVTGADLSTFTCDGGNTVTPLTAGTAQCTFSAGLLSSDSPYAVAAAYTTTDSNFVPSNGSSSETVAPGKTTTVVTSSSNPSVTNQPVTFTATVAPAAPASGTLSGSVTFAGVTCDGGNTVPVAGGLAQCIISGGLDASGSPFTVTGTYGSDPNFAASASKAIKQTVNTAAATVVLASDPNTCTGDLCTTTQGSPLTFTATASSGNGTPTGSVQFLIVPAGQKAKNSLTCDGGNNLVDLIAGQASCTFANGLPAIVYYTVTATLVDPNYQGASATLYENTSLISTNTTVPAPKNITAGESFPVTATVTPLGPSSNVPTGSVDITVCGSNSNGNNGCQGGTEPVAPDGTATLLIGGGEYPGSYDAFATYLGDQNFYGSTAKKRLFHVDETPTSIAIGSSANPSEDGSGVTLTATVSAANDAAGSTLVGPPSGSVTFTITGPGGAETCTGGNTISLDLGQADEDVAECNLPPGTLTDPASPTGNTNYAVQVSYLNDGDYLGSNASVNQVVVPLVD